MKTTEFVCTAGSKEIVDVVLPADIGRGLHRVASKYDGIRPPLTGLYVDVEDYLSHHGDAGYHHTEGSESGTGAGSMSEQDFTAAVAEMRENQRVFFRSAYGSDAKQKALAMSKHWERIVDREVKRRQSIETGETMDL